MKPRQVTMVATINITEENFDGFFDIVDDARWKARREGKVCEVELPSLGDEVMVDVVINCEPQDDSVGHMEPWYTLESATYKGVDVSKFIDQDAVLAEAVEELS